MATAAAQYSCSDARKRGPVASPDDLQALGETQGLLVRE
jgi:hypothetical protein